MLGFSAVASGEYRTVPTHTFIASNERYPHMVLSAALAAPVLQAVSSGILEQVLTVLVVLAVGILVGRLALRIAWRLVTVGAFVVGTLLLVLMFAPNAL